jgi:hypothetical protein
MRVLGLNFQKGKIRSVILDDEKSNLFCVSSKRSIIDSDLDLPILMDRYSLNLRASIDEFKPNMVAAKLTYESKNIDAAITHIMPLGILALICHEKSLPIYTFTSQSLRSSAGFGLQKGLIPIDVVDAKFGKFPPYWDEAQKNALLVAWRAYLDNH